MAIVEACVETLAEALAAEEGGAARIELCVNLAEAGTTPPEDLIEACVSRLRIPVFVMVRPGPGPFTCTARELALLCTQAARAHAIGAHGVVTGVLTGARAIDRAAMRALVEAAAPLPVTCHRAFDLAGDRDAAAGALVEAGVARVLTSGGAPTAEAGAGEIARLVDRWADRLVVVAAGTVRPPNVAALVAATRVTEVHAHLASAEEVAALVRAARAPAAGLETS